MNLRRRLNVAGGREGLCPGDGGALWGRCVMLGGSMTATVFVWKLWLKGCCKQGLWRCWAHGGQGVVWLCDAGPLFLESCVILVEGTFVHEIWRPAKKHRHTASYAPRVEVGHTPGDSPGWVTDCSALGSWTRCASAFLPASQVGGPIIKIGGRDSLSLHSLPFCHPICGGATVYLH